MLFDNDGAYPPLSRWFAQQLAFLEAGSDPSLIGASAAEISGQGNTQGDYPSGGKIPPMHWIDSASFSVVLIAGTDDILQAANLVSAWSTRVPNNTYPGLPTYFDDVGFQVGARVTSLGRRPADRIFFVGHSLGGSIAQAAAAMYKRAKPGVSVLSVSFGSPRVGDRRFAQTQTQNSNTRWMNDDDPVPLLPPSIPAALSYGIGLGAEVISRWEQFVHGGGGVILDGNGNPTPGDVPPRGVVAGGSSLASWLMKAAEGGVSQHSMSTYYDRLNMLVNRVAPPMPIQVREAPAEPSRINDRHTHNQATDAFISNIVHTGAQQQQGSLIVPPDRPFKTVKFDGLWWVTFGGELVAVGGTRKRAGRMAVLGNDFLRRIQRQAGVDTVALKRLFSDYLDAASVPGNGFSPVISAFPTV
jgi:pimeloyl-ACP methyl ester carboxylesterase